VHQVSDAVTGGGYSHNIPTGHWRDGLCECCAFGCCHPVFCLGYCYNLCLLGQVLTRNKLSCIGLPTGKVEPCSYRFWFAMVFVIFAIKVGVVWMFVLVVVSLDVDTDDDCFSYSNRYYRSCTTYDTYEYTGPKWVIACLVLFGVFLSIISCLECIATCKARESLRNKYHIEGGCCEDCCCTICCPLCTLCQMARHTADYHVHQAYCCTATGLSPQAPEVV
jgi:Cys-rich protein (TIGR01571 family)